MINDVTFFVSKREEFRKEIEKNLKFMTMAGHGVQSEGERIIAKIISSSILFYNNSKFKYYSFNFNKKRGILYAQQKREAIAG